MTHADESGHVLRCRGRLQGFATPLRDLSASSHADGLQHHPTRQIACNAFSTWFPQGSPFATHLFATPISEDKTTPTDQITLQTHLWRMPEYRALDPKRRKLASAMLLDNQSITAACNAIGGLNSSREKKNKALAACLRAFNLSGGPSEATETTSAADANLYDHIRRREELLGAAPTDPEAGSSDTVIALEPTDWLRVHLGIRDLPVHPKALPAERAKLYSEHLANVRPDRRPCGFCGTDVVDDIMCAGCRRERGGDSPYKRAVCDGCAGPLPVRYVRGVHVMCAPCHEGWQRTGKLQGAR